MPRKPIYFNAAELLIRSTHKLGTWSWEEVVMGSREVERRKETLFSIFFQVRLELGQYFKQIQFVFDVKEPPLQNPSYISVQASPQASNSFCGSPRGSAPTLSTATFHQSMSQRPFCKLISSQPPWDAQSEDGSCEIGNLQLVQF